MTRYQDDKMKRSKNLNRNSKSKTNLLKGSVSHALVFRTIHLKWRWEKSCIYNADLYLLPTCCQRKKEPKALVPEPISATINATSNPMAIFQLPPGREVPDMADLLVDVGSHWVLVERLDIFSTNAQCCWKHGRQSNRHSCQKLALTTHSLQGLFA